MLNVMIVSRFIAADLNGRDVGTRETIAADMRDATFDRMAPHDTSLGRRPNLRKVVYRG